MLTWHYRSRDERLIAFSNEHIYDRTLTTFPGADADQVLRHVPAPWSASADTNSPEPEVNTGRRADLRARTQRPNESLGVITMGIKHANRIEEAVRQRLRNDPQLAARFARFFDEDQEERFFVKTSSGSRVMNGTPSSCRSAMARIQTGPLSTVSGRCSTKAENGGLTWP